MRSRSLLSPYPLSRSSRNRRRMLIICGEGESQSERNDDEQQSEIVSAVVDSPATTTKVLLTADQSQPQQPVVEIPPVIKTTPLAKSSPQKNSVKPVSQSSTFIQLQHLLQKQVPVCWVFAGDGMTAGGDAFDHVNNDQSLSANPQLPFSSLFERFLFSDRDRSQDAVLNVGSATESAEFLWINLEERVLSLLPDVVSISLAFNNCKQGQSQQERYHNRLVNIIESIRQAGAIPILQTPYRVSLKQNPHLAGIPGYVKMMRIIARDEDVPCIDHWAHWKPLCSHPRKLSRLLAEDGLHLNAKGTEVVTKLIIKRIGKSCQLPHWSEEISFSNLPQQQQQQQDQQPPLTSQTLSTAINSLPIKF